MNYYRLREIIKPQGISLSVNVELATLFVNNIGKLVTLTNYKNNLKVVLYNSSEAANYKAFLLTLKAESQNSEWNSILVSVINDVENNKNKTVSQIMSYVN